jgi:hypothetical protein
MACFRDTSKDDDPLSSNRHITERSEATEGCNGETYAVSNPLPIGALFGGSKTTVTYRGPHSMDDAAQRSLPTYAAMVAIL